MKINDFSANQYYFVEQNLKNQTSQNDDSFDLDVMTHENDTAETNHKATYPCGNVSQNCSYRNCG